MNHRMIIGLTGQAGAGKDTVADFLTREFGFTKVAFADALRMEIAHTFGIHIDKLMDRATKEIPCPALALSCCSDHRFVGLVLDMEISLDCADEETLEAIMNQPRSPRWTMQRWGTEYRRKLFGSDYWATELAQRCADLPGNIVVTDVRFEEEAELISTVFGGEIWRISRDNLPAVLAHSSETPLQECWIDREISNNNSFDALDGATQQALAMAIKAQRGEVEAA